MHVVHFVACPLIRRRRLRRQGRSRTLPARGAGAARLGILLSRCVPPMVCTCTQAARDRKLFARTRARARGASLPEVGVDAIFRPFAHAPAVLSSRPAAATALTAHMLRGAARNAKPQFARALLARARARGRRLCYWILHSLAILEALPPRPLLLRSAAFLARCQDPAGGFCGGAPLPPFHIYTRARARTHTHTHQGLCDGAPPPAPPPSRPVHTHIHTPARGFCGCVCVRVCVSARVRAAGPGQLPHLAPTYAAVNSLKRVSQLS